jgi:hypothetical protein
MVSQFDITNGPFLRNGPNVVVEQRMFNTGDLVDTLH